jgi:NADH:ubiquinone oxidoreductase subunit 3 (subunit A)
MFPYANLFAIIFLIALIPVGFLILARLLGAYQKVNDRLQDSFDKSEYERKLSDEAYLASPEHSHDNVRVL